MEIDSAIQESFRKEKFFKMDMEILNFCLDKY